MAEAGIHKQSQEQNMNMVTEDLLSESTWANSIKNRNKSRVLNPSLKQYNNKRSRSTNTETSIKMTL